MTKTGCTGRYRVWMSSRAASYGVLLGTLLALAACKKTEGGDNPGAQTGKVAESPSSREPISLTIVGFNYTDLYIDSFEVNNVGGGNVFVSDMTSGGGGSTCCVDWFRGRTIPKLLKITWTRDRERWCQKEIETSGPIPTNPTHLGVHFFPDGRIEAELSEGYPELKLRLESVNAGQRKKVGNVVMDEKVARCQDAYPY